MTQSAHILSRLNSREETNQAISRVLRNIISFVDSTTPLATTRQPRHFAFEISRLLKLN